MKLKHLLSSFIFFSATFAAHAQVAANLQGRVVDSSGAGVPNAQIELTETSTNVRQHTTSSSSGGYLFTHLNPGAYQFDVTASGFQHLSHLGVTATVGQTVSADLLLTVGTEQQTITVNEDRLCYRPWKATLRLTYPAQR